MIPDGNRRWAKKKNKDFDFGYLQLPITINRIINVLKKQNIDRLHFWCNSIDNIRNRPYRQVVSFLDHYLEILKYSSQPDELRVHIKGNLQVFKDEGLPEYCEGFLMLQDETKNSKNFDLYYYLNYTTMDDIQRALAMMCTEQSVNSENVLSTLDEPDNIDMILRTGGYHRLSGFCPVKSPNCEIIFVPELFPDLSQDRINQAIEIYNNRTLNNGG